LILLISRKKPLIFLCTDAWPQYPLGDQEKWPSEGSLIIIPNSNYIFSVKGRKSELRSPIYSFSFISRTTQNGSMIAIQILKNRPFFVSMATNMGKEDQKRSLSLLLHPLPYLLNHLNTWNPLMDVSPSTGCGRKRASLCPLLVIRSKGN
jgi:hypothetical protein